MLTNQKMDHTLRSNRSLLGIVSFFLLTAILLAACQSATPKATEVPATVAVATAPQVEPSVLVEDQKFDAGKVTITSPPPS